jgi:hypothetical protein
MGVEIGSEFDVENEFVTLAQLIEGDFEGTFGMGLDH